jgi:hypothetical protein
MMTLSGRDRRALILLAAAAAFSLAVYFWPQGSAVEIVTPRADSIPAAERRLARLRGLAATIPARQAVLAEAKKDLEAREKGLLNAETSSQAQAAMLQLIRKLAREQSPPVEISQTELGAIAPFGQDYGEALVTVSYTCRIEQLVNLMADLSAQPEMVATRDLIVRAADPKQKTVFVRMALSGVVPKRLAPERKEGGLF